MSQFQVKYSDEAGWKEISENRVLGKLVDEFGQITPVIAEMVEGKEIISSDGIFRMKEIGQKGKGMFLNIEI